MRTKASLITMVALVICPCLSKGADAQAEWRSLFNGRDLSGWTIKIAKHPLNENYANTFRVEEGVIKVSYDDYEAFEGRFGHLYTNQPYSHYVLRLEYKFTGTAMADAPHWAKLNSGVMVHSQSPLSMKLDQAWPVSMEMQFLAVGATAGRQTANAVTPGTNLEINGRFLTDHIIDSNAKLHPLDEWVAAEIEVRGNEEIVHRINGVEVLRYQHPQLDPREESPKRLMSAGAHLQLSFGHIALQAEGQEIWFRNIMIRPLNK